MFVAKEISSGFKFGHVTQGKSKLMVNRVGENNLILIHCRN